MGQGSDTGSDVQDDNGHGTHIAGIITSDGTALAPRGIAPGCRLVVVKALDANNSGWVSDLVAGLDWIVEHHAEFPQLHFVNLSLFVSDPPAQCPCDGLPGLSALEDAIMRGLADGIICLAASGNDGAGENPRAPACFGTVVSVGAAYDSAYARAPGPADSVFSDFGPYPSCADLDVTTYTMACFTSRAGCLDFVAPGYAITSCEPYDPALPVSASNDGVVTAFGTSQAVAHLTGTLALMQQAAPRRGAGALLQFLRLTALPVEDPESPGTFYKGVDAQAAALAAMQSRAEQWTLYR
jgi:minor extracellular protease Epr